jgi:SAM-dependent methyltransferase
MPAVMQDATLTLRRRWLRILSKHRFVREFIVPVLAAAVMRLVLHFLGFGGSTVPREIGTDIVLLAIGYFLIRESYLWGLKPVRDAVFRLAAAAQDPGRTFLLTLATNQTTETVRIIEGLAGTGYRVDPPELMQEWFSTFFDHGGPTYLGVDRNLPHMYYKRYDWFLELHAGSINKHPRSKVKHDLRVIETTRNDLSSSYYHDRSLYRRFISWHKARRNDIDLRWVDKNQAGQKIRDRFGLPADTDVGLWTNFAVLFQNNQDKSVTISMVFDSGERKGFTLAKIERFIKAMQQESAEFPEIAPNIETVDKALAEKWPLYVDIDARTDPDGPWAAFLTKALANQPQILDAAAGVGCESMILRRAGHAVFTNEVDDNFAQVATDVGADRGCALYMVQYNWEDMGPGFLGGLLFDGIVCVGNSLCLVEDDTRREECVAAFYSCLKPGGTLVIDERNFEWMIDNAAEIEEDPVTAFSPTLEGDCMYHGKTMRGYPADVSDTRVTWRFFSAEGIRDSGQLRDAAPEFPDLILHPFRFGELFELLATAGFRTIDVYADIEQIATSADEMPSQELVGQSSFITYVARRPLSEDHTPAEEPSER